MAKQTMEKLHDVHNKIMETVSDNEATSLTVSYYDLMHENHDINKLMNRIMEEANALIKEDFDYYDKHCGINKSLACITTIKKLQSIEELKNKPTFNKLYNHEKIKDSVHKWHMFLTQTMFTSNLIFKEG